MAYYNPKAYVPGGAALGTARAIQALGRKRPVVKRPTATRPTVPIDYRPGATAAPARPAADPMLTRAQGIAGQLYNPLLTQLGAAQSAGMEAARKVYETHANAQETALRASGAAIPQAFDTGIAQAAKTNEALANRLSGQGTIAGNDLAAKLAQISADPAGAATLSQGYQGAGNAQFASGSADLQNLIGQRAQAAAYQGKLPGIARLAASQDLQKVISDQQGYFAQEGQNLRNSAVEEAGNLYSQYRTEAMTNATNKAEAQQNLLEIAQRDRASLRALAAAATTNKEKLMYQSQEKALDRQLKADIANLNANTKVQTATISANKPPKPGAVTGPANQKFITVNGKKTKNPNYVPPTTATGSTGDTWKTPGSAKRNRVEQRAWSAVVSPEGGWNADLLRKLKKYPNSADAIINTAINQAMRSAGVSTINDSSAGEIRKAIRKRLSGRTYTVDGYDEPFTFRA